MDSCKNCGTKFNFWKVLKSFLRNYKNLDCSNCGAEHKHKLVNRIFGAFFIAIALAMSNPAPVFHDFTITKALICIGTFLGIYIWLAGIASFWARFKLVDVSDSKVSYKV
ncbi:MAG: TIGR04104 family putative zinc finger protein [Leeuwenhoekiella sp.]